MKPPHRIPFWQPPKNYLALTNEMDFLINQKANGKPMIKTIRSFKSSKTSGINVKTPAKLSEVNVKILANILFVWDYPLPLAKPIAFLINQKANGKPMTNKIRSSRSANTVPT